MKEMIQKMKEMEKCMKDMEKTMSGMKDIMSNDESMDKKGMDESKMYPTMKKG